MFYHEIILVCDTIEKLKSVRVLRIENVNNRYNIFSCMLKAVEAIKAKGFVCI